MSSLPSTTSGQHPRPPDDPGGGEVVVAIDGLNDDLVNAAAVQVRAAVERDFSGRKVELLVSDRREHAPRLSPWNPAAPVRTSMPSLVHWGSIAAGGIPGNESALPALLREADQRGARATALVAGEPHDDAVRWLQQLVQPALEGYDCVCPAYLRHRLDGTLVTGLVYPLTRALYGQRLRQPLGGEVALSLPLVRHLLASETWERDPVAAGSDSWLFAEALSGGFKVCQAVVGARVFRPPEHQEASQMLARVAGLLFRQMEHLSQRWQRVSGSKPVTTFGELRTLEGTVNRPQVDRLVEGFVLGLKNLQPLWALVLNPGTLLALKRAAQVPAAAFRLDDRLWARIVYDFAIAHLTRAMERSQLLHSITPLYLAWVAGFANEVEALDLGQVEDRVETLCLGFEAEKPYLISRWRWPDRFNP